jgi:hypothetical protein
MNTSMEDLSRTVETVIQRYHRVPFCNRLTHEFLLTEGRGQVENLPKELRARDVRMGRRGNRGMHAEEA